MSNEHITAFFLTSQGSFYLLVVTVVVNVAVVVVDVIVVVFQVVEVVVCVVLYVAVFDVVV